ncbi:MAG: protein DpdG, partial [Planctomycetaceae bacterium]
QNDTRWAGFKSWATFLGFGRSESGKASGGFITDPTPAIRRYALQLLPKKGDIAINDFVEGLALSIPVLDGGEYRKEVESKLRPEKWRAPGEGELSTSLSRALWRLRDAGEIRLKKKADSDVQMKLVGQDRSVEGVTHVLRGEGK